MKSLPRMLMCLLVTVALMVLSLLLQAKWPGTLIAVTAYKAHLMALGGWGGYWLDRALFPYDRPHEYLIEPAGVDPTINGPEDYQAHMATATAMCSASTYGQSMLRRALIVAACLLCVGLGA